jgi:UDP-glucose 4-epimerase
VEKTGAVFVTGATGFVGRAVVAALQEGGREVRALVRAAGQQARLDWQGWDRPVAIVEGSLEDPATYADALDGCTSVVHLAAALPSGSHQATDTEGLFRVNVVATEVLGRAAVRAAVPHFVYCSAGNAYQPRRDGTLRRETDALYPMDHSVRYLMSKIAGEIVLGAELHGSDTRLAIVRPTSIYGAGMNATGLIQRWIASAATGSALVLHGNSRYGTDMVDVRDVAAAISRLVSTRVDGVYNLGTGIRLELPDIARAILDAAGSSARIDATAARGDIGPGGFDPVDSTAAINHLGFNSRPFREGVADMFADDT